MNHIIKSIIKYSFLTLILIVLLTPLSFTLANHRKGTFPNAGLLWMSGKKNYSGSVFLTSNNCNSAETDAYNRIKQSTTGTWEMGRWKNGINMKQYGCDGAWDNLTDIKLQYAAGHPSDAWGENHDALAVSAFCQYWNVSYPCGMRPTVHINLTTWNSVNSTNRARLIMHETGHSHGLNHHCNSDSIMNDGTSGCNGGKWAAVMQYYPTDAEGISGIYP